MLGEKALELVKELQRSRCGTLPPFNVSYFAKQFIQRKCCQWLRFPFPCTLKVLIRVDVKRTIYLRNNHGSFLLSCSLTVWLRLLAWFLHPTHWFFILCTGFFFKTWIIYYGMVYLRVWLNTAKDPQKTRKGALHRTTEDRQSWENCQTCNNFV